MRRSKRRYYLSLIVNLAALGTLVWVAHDQFDLPRQEAAALLGGIFLVAVGIILLAGLFAGLWIALRKWTRRDQGPDSE